MAAIPTHIAIDTRDGYVFWRDSDGKFFDGSTGQRFINSRNREQHEPTYVLAELSLPAFYTGQVLDACTACGANIIRDYTGTWRDIAFDLLVGDSICAMTTDTNHVPSRASA